MAWGDRTGGYGVRNENWPRGGQGGEAHRLLPRSTLAPPPPSGIQGNQGQSSLGPGVKPGSGTPPGGLSGGALREGSPRVGQGTALRGAP